VIEVWNKVDLLGDPERQALLERQRRDPGSRPVVVSALTGEGAQALLDRVEDMVAAGRATLDIALPATDGAGLAWLHQTCDVLSRRDDETGTVHLRVRVAPERIAQVRQRFGAAVEAVS
jgi:GTP-binding protein HflX